MRMFDIIVTVMAFAIVLSLLLGCAGRAQPFGEDIWVGLDYVEKQRVKNESEKQAHQSPAVRQRVNHNSNAGR